MADDVLLEKRAGTALITLNAPHRRNALDAGLARRLIAVCAEVDADPSLGAAVVTGAGGYFCAGGERATLDAAGERPADPDVFDAMGDIYQSFMRVGALGVPTIAAITGGAVGAGMNLALATDLRVVATDARLLSGFLRIGLHQGGGHGTLLARTGSREAASALSLFGAELTGSRAAELGLAWAAVPAGEVLDRALELAAVPAADPALARRTTRSLRLQAVPDDAAWQRGLDLERAAQMWSMRRKHLQDPH